MDTGLNEKGRSEDLSIDRPESPGPLRRRVAPPSARKLAVSRADPNDSGLAQSPGEG